MRRQVPRPDVGVRFAYRERARALGEPVLPVEVVRLGPPRSRKVRVRYLGGQYEGLEDWIPVTRLVARWADAASLLRDERALLHAVELSEPDLTPVVEAALDQVFAAVAASLGRRPF